MTDMTATAQLQAWLDGTIDTLSKTAVRTVLWDLAQAQARLAQLGTTEVEWTVAQHELRNIQYGDAMTESYARNEAYKEFQSGATASVAYRIAGEWRHEDPSAQEHRDQLVAGALTIAKPTIAKPAGA